MKTSKAGLDLIKRHEGLRLEAYLCPADKWTIGYGTTSDAGVGEIRKGMKITEAQAAEWLARSLEGYEAAVSKAVTRTPTANQFAAMVSLCYNIGQGAFAASTVVRRFNAGDVQGAADAFRMWTKGGGKVLPGLVRRREDERNLFLAQPKSDGIPLPFPQPEAKPQPQAGSLIAKWVIGAIAALLAAAAAFIAKG